MDKSSPLLWNEQEAANEIPADYSILDLAPYCFSDAKMNVDIIVKHNVRPDLVTVVLQLFDSSEIGTLPLLRKQTLD